MKAAMQGRRIFYVSTGLSHPTLEPLLCHHLWPKALTLFSHQKIGSLKAETFHYSWLLLGVGTVPGTERALRNV